MASTATNTDAQPDTKFDDYSRTFSATASTSGTSTIQIEKGYLTELVIRIDGDVSAGDLSGGPVAIEAYLKRSTFTRHLCRGGVLNDHQVKGSGQLWIPSRSDIVIKWNNGSASAVTLRVSPIVSREARGDSAPGWTDETPDMSWIYQARRVATSPAGGGVLVIRIQVAAGQIARLVQCAIVGPASAGATLITNILDEDGNGVFNIGAVAAGATRITILPTVGTTPAVHNNMGTSENLILGSGEYFAATASASLQNETLTVGIVLELFNLPTIPTWDTTGSAAGTTLAASTISAANTLTAGRIWE